MASEGVLASLRAGWNALSRVAAAPRVAGGVRRRPAIVREAFLTDGSSRGSRNSVPAVAARSTPLAVARRSANVVAEGDVECVLFELEDLNRLLETHPRLHTKILRNISVSLATKLRKVHEDVHILIAARE